MAKKKRSKSGEEAVTRRKNGGVLARHAVRGAEGSRPHEIRRVCVGVLLEGGVHPKIVQELLGHATITTTLDMMRGEEH